MLNRLSIPVFWLTVLALASGRLAAAPTLSPQSTSTEGVTVKATPRAVSGDAWEFEVVMDTHSQNLNDDLMNAAVLSTADGATSAPVAWQGDPPGGHHRKGALRFKAPKPGTKAIELRILRPGEPAPRIFRWRLE